MQDEGRKDISTVEDKDLAVKASMQGSSPCREHIGNFLFQPLVSFFHPVVVP